MSSILIPYAYNMTKVKKIKINLGCGKRVQKGFINVDNYIEPLGKGFEFKKADLTKKLPFKDEYADYIIMIDVIEHIPILQVEGVLKEVYRVMKPGSKFVLITTDFTNVAIDWIDMMNRGENLEEYLKVAQVVYGNQVTEGEFHRCPFTPKFMNIVMQSAGFTDYKLTKFFKGSLVPKFDGDVSKKGMVYINDMLVVEATKVEIKPGERIITKEELLEVLKDKKLKKRKK